MEEEPRLWVGMLPLVPRKMIFTRALQDVLNSIGILT
jgi:hypothetical protein